MQLSAQASDVVICTIFKKNSYRMINMIYIINMDERAPLTALEFLHTIKFEKAGDKRG